MANVQSFAKATRTIYSLTGTVNDLRVGVRHKDRLYGSFAFRTAAGRDRTVILLVPPAYVASVGDDLKIASGRGPTSIRGFFTELAASDRLPKRDAFIPFKVISRPELPAAAERMTSTTPSRSLDHQHERSGFWRTQHYGPGHRLTKQVYIAAVTVRADRPKKAA